MKTYRLVASIMTALSILFIISCTYKTKNVQHHNAIEVKNAWVRALPPNMKMTAAYMKIHNHSGMEDQLELVETPIAGVVETHMVVKKDEVMSMKPVPHIPVPAMGVKELKPGGYHLMLIQLNKVPQKGEQVPMLLHFKHAGTMEITATVQESPSKGMNDDTDMDHSGHGSGMDQSKKEMKHGS